jgi:hypothetical protein
VRRGGRRVLRDGVGEQHCRAHQQQDREGRPLETATAAAAGNESRSAARDSEPQLRQRQRRPATSSPIQPPPRRFACTAMRGAARTCTMAMEKGRKGRGYESAGGRVRMGDCGALGSAGNSGAAVSAERGACGSVRMDSSGARSRGWGGVPSAARRGGMPRRGTDRRAGNRFEPRLRRLSRPYATAISEADFESIGNDNERMSICMVLRRRWNKRNRR